MPTVQCSRIVNADLSTNWNFVKEIDNWATLLPGYQSHEKIDQFHSTWTVRGEVGVLARTVQLEVLIDEWNEESKVAFTLSGLTEIVDGNGVFRLLGPGAAVGAGTAVVTPAGATQAPVKTSWFTRLFARFRRRKAPQQGAPQNQSPRAVPPGQSGFDFELKLLAGGMIGPVVNVMLEGMIAKLGEEFATNVAGAVESSKV